MTVSPSAGALLAATLAAIRPAPLWAGARPRYGGEALVLLRGTVPSSLDPQAAEGPAERVAARLLFEPLVAEDGGALLMDVPRPGDDPRKLSLVVRPSLSFHDGTALTAEHVAAAFARLAAQPHHAPYAALALPVASARAVHAALVEVEVRFSYPDFARLLAAPALAPARQRGAGAEARWIGAGPFAWVASRARGTRLVAWKECPTGRPFLDALVLAHEADPRRAMELVERGEATAAVVGEAGRVTYLAIGRKQAQAESLRATVLAEADPAELVGAFVRAPADPAPAPGSPAVAPLAAGASLSLLFAAGEPDHRSVAERIQVRLRRRGIDVRLFALPSADLRGRLAAGTYAIALFAPPRLPDPGAEAAALELLFGSQDAALALLAEIGAAASPAERAAAAARARAAVEARAWLTPLYTEKARLATGERLVDLFLDPLGVPRLAEAWLGPAP